MPLAEHLREFRSRTLKAFVGLVIGAVVGWFLFDPVFHALAAPVVQIEGVGRDAALNFTTVAGAFDMKMRVAVFIGAVITAPWWLYQTWAFLAPGLRHTERRYVLGFTVASLPLFLVGVALGWGLLPHAVRVFMSFTPDAAANFIDARTYLTFCMRIVLAFGFAFLFPVVMVALNLLGIVRAQTYVRGWRWAVIILFTLAALANPLPDPWTMIALGLVMTALYYAAVGVCMLTERRRARRAAQRDADLGIA